MTVFRTCLCALAGLAACQRAALPGNGAKRVISQVVFADEELWHLGEDVRERVIAVSTMADDARYSDAVGQWPSTVPRTGGAEAIVALAPDLVITAEFTAVETRTTLVELGITTLSLEGWNGFDDYRRHVRALAKSVDAFAAGEARIAEFDTAVMQLRAQAEEQPTPTVVSWQEGMVAGANTSFDDIATTAGFVNVARARGVVGHHNIAVETLVAWDPQFIVVPCETDCPSVEVELAARPGIAATRAAKNRHIIAISSHHLYSVGLGMLEVSRQLQARRAEALR